MLDSPHGVEEGVRPCGGGVLRKAGGWVEDDSNGSHTDSEEVDKLVGFVVQDSADEGRRKGVG